MVFAFLAAMFCGMALFVAGNWDSMEPTMRILMSSLLGGYVVGGIGYLLGI